MGYELDMINRDPNGINDHVRVLFEDVIAEPDGAHSINCVWNCAYKCFNGCKDAYYKSMTCWYGIPLAMCWGCEFAYITFVHVWYVTPCLRIYMINCACLQKFYGTCLKCYCQPLCEVYGYCLSNIRVTNLRG